MNRPLADDAAAAVHEFATAPGRRPAEAAAAMVTASVALLEARTDSGHAMATLRAILQRLGSERRRVVAEGAEA